MTPIKVGIGSTDWSRTIVDRTGAPIPGGSGWVRLQQLRPHVKFETVTGLLIYHDKKGFGIADYYGKVHFNCQVIVMQRLMFGDLVRSMTEVLSRPNRPLIVNDVDDWYWGLDPANAAYTLTRPEKNKDENIDHYKEIIRLSDAVTVSTPFLKDKMENWLGHTNVHMVENCVTMTDFNRRRLNLKKAVVGWVGSTAHRSRDLEELHGFFSGSYKFHHSGHIHGAPLFSDAIGVDRNRVTKSPMHPPKQYAQLSFCFDIGIAPLSDKPFNHAKSWIKAIEYAAAGVPFVASRAPEYTRLHEEYGIGRLATTKDEWLGHIDELKNPAVRSAEAQRNLQLVKQLDVKRMASQWQTIIEGLL